MFCSENCSVTDMSRSFTAPQALLRLQDISVDCSDVEYCNSKIDNALDND